MTREPLAIPVPGGHNQRLPSMKAPAFSRATLAGLATLAALLLRPLPVRAADAFGIVAKWPLPGASTRFDYLIDDPVDHRLYVSHDTAFDVLDTRTGAVVGHVAPTSRAHGVALAHAAGHGFATSGGDNAVVMFDLASLAVLKRIPSTGKGPDSVRYDAASDRVYVANHQAETSRSSTRSPAPWSPPRWC